MNMMASRLGRLWHDRRAATAVEYGFILAVVVLVMLVALHNLADTTTGLWNNMADKVTSA